MKNKKYYYAGIGMIIGTGIGGALAVMAYSYTGNPVLIAFAGVGTALGLIFGAGLDKQQNK